MAVHNDGFTWGIYNNSMNDIKIRVATPDDAPELLAIYAPYVTDTAVTFEYEVPSLTDFRARINTTLNRYPYIVALRGGEIVGYAYASPFRVRAAYVWSVETSIYVRCDKKHAGVGTALYEALEALLSRQHVTNMYACIAVPNGEDPHLTRDSIRFHGHMGFTNVGEYRNCAYKFGRWYSMAMMEKCITPHLLPQPDFIPFTRLSK